MPAAIDNMAYVNEVPWHGLGNQLTDNADIDQWRIDAGLNWEAKKSDMMYETEGGNLYYETAKQVIYRSDTEAWLGVVSPNFKIVQPAEVMEFFRDLTELGKFKMETAGSLFGGKKIWALARHNKQAKLPGNDVVKPYLLLATGMDGSLATNAQFTTVRVVCNNTLQMALSRSHGHVRVTHRGTFYENEVKAELGLMDEEFSLFTEYANKLAEKKVTSQAERMDYFARVFNPNYEELSLDDQSEYLELPTIQQVADVYEKFPGQSLKSAADTAWGLVNGVTAYLDHVRNTQTVDARLNSAWFGNGADLKERALHLAMEL